MAKPYPMDMCDRVVEAIEKERLWRHEAAASDWICRSIESRDLSSAELVARE
jgi:hypothetical protein